MTIIVWDGKTLSADKRSLNNGLCLTVTKIYRLKTGELFGMSGEMVFCSQVKEWVEAGCIVADFPTAQRDKDDWQPCLVVSRDGKGRVYERTPFPNTYDDNWCALGSGRDYAVAALHLGKTAKEAVEVACLFDCGCGNGIDTLELE